MQWVVLYGGRSSIIGCSLSLASLPLCLSLSRRVERLLVIHLRSARIDASSDSSPGEGVCMGFGIVGLGKLRTTPGIPHHEPPRVPCFSGGQALVWLMLTLETAPK